MAPFKRVRQPKMTTQALLGFDLGESDSDSDFRIEDHNVSDDDCSSSKDDDDSYKSDDSDEGDENEENSEEDSDESDNSDTLLKDLVGTKTQTNGGGGLESMLKKLNTTQAIAPKLPTKPICCVCLGDRSDDSNEIIECDGCGVSVHEGCYGVGDNVSISSTNSTCSTEPWFCEACRAGVSEPVCELCPNKGGIYKETDVGKWVHLVCALYVPGVAFGEVDQLSSVTLFEMQWGKWGAKVCSLCEQARFARTGVCIGCDAGMCKTYFHVTCAQAAGFLTEAHHEEAEAADPFYAHCKVHSEKEMVKKRKRNFHTFRLNMQQKMEEKLEQRLDDTCPAQIRIHRKLLKYQRKYGSHKLMKSEPWVPTQKMSRLLTTSASACRRLLGKAEIMSVDVESLERQEAQIAALTDIRKKWHIAPAFSVEFIGYYLDRISRTKELKEELAEMMENNATLSGEQDSLRKDYDARLEKNKELKTKQESLMSNIQQLHKQLGTLCPNKNLLNPANIGRPHVEAPKIATPPTRPISVPTAAALKMGVGFPLAHLGPPGSKVDSTRLLSTHAKSSPTTCATNTISAPSTPTLGVQTFDCGICKRCSDQHLLAKCDTCQLHYHLGCLNPPLTRHPKKSKLYGWQCSECDKSDESDAMSELPKGPRKSRTRFNKDGAIVPVLNFECVTDTQFSKEPTIQQPANKRKLDQKPVTGLPAKKLLNKSLPATLDESNISIGKPLTVRTTPELAKKSKLSLSYVSPKNDTDKMNTLTKNTTILVKKTKQSSPIGNPICRSNFKSTDELLLPLPTAAAAPKPADAAKVTEAPADPLALPPATSSNVIINLDDSFENSKPTRKQKRKDKHRNKHLNLSSDTDKSPNKEHKRKRKKKIHDHDAENPGAPPTGIPKIKIKFKTLPLPGEVTPEAKFFYVSADMVRSAEEGSRPTSVETVEDVATNPSTADINVSGKDINTTMAPSTLTPSTLAPSTLATSTLTPSTTETSAKIVVPSTRKSSPRKANPRSSFTGRSKATPPTIPQQLNCCVCQELGATSNVVTCDECRKNYHFTCLEPPLKKTPKIRGYSWHCADCDPTEEEH